MDAASAALLRSFHGFGGCQNGNQGETGAASYAALCLSGYPMALKREVPFRAHGAVDKALGLVIPPFPGLAPRFRPGPSST